MTPSETSDSGTKWRITLATDPPATIEIPDQDFDGVESAIAYLREHYPSARDVRVWSVIPIHPAVLKFG